MATDAWGKKIWEPEKEPYRVLVTYRSGQAGCQGWASRCHGTYATLAEAQAVLNKPWPAGVTQVDVHHAVFKTEWSQDGRWVKIASRSAKKKKAKAA